MMLHQFGATVILQALYASALVLPNSQAPLASSTAKSTDDTGYRIPTIGESAALAREILRNESIATLSTVFPTSSNRSPDVHRPDGASQLDDEDDDLQVWENRPSGLGGMAIGLMDYYADCEDSGNPTILAISIATSFRNTAAGSNVSMAVQQHPYIVSTSSASSDPSMDGISTNSLLVDRTSADTILPNNDFPSPAAHARFSLLGHIEAIPESEVADGKIKDCFLERHPDARAWLPGNSIHESWWARLVVEEVYWIGGFGDRAYIGWIPVEVWRRAGRVR